mmetsp:Transcript_62046/g.110344  ORF Transcript_62046/g.110344 Transcript_62046/m.110344 type:complete len:276 (-) Transcript_62046:14-841(-)
MQSSPVVALHPPPSTCCLDIEADEFLFIQLQGADKGSAASTLLGALREEPALNGSTNGRAQASSSRATGRVPWTLLARHGGGDCLVVPRNSAAAHAAAAAAASRHGSDAAAAAASTSSAERPWVALTLPSASPLGHLHSTLTCAGVEVLAFAAPCSGPPCALLPAADLAKATSLLVAAGFAIGPPSRLHGGLPSRALSSSTPALATHLAGVWARPEPGESCGKDAKLPHALRFESSAGIYIDIRIPTCNDPGSLRSAQASSSGIRRMNKQGVSRR